MEKSAQFPSQFKAMVTIELEAEWFERCAPVRGCVQHVRQPRPGDSLVIMEAGWRSLHERITSRPIIANGTFEFGVAHTCLLGENIYQICYVDSDELVLGFSRSFTIGSISTVSDIQISRNVDVMVTSTKESDKEIALSLSSTMETDFEVVGKQMSATSLCCSCMLRSVQPPQCKPRQDTASQSFPKTTTDACTQTEILHQNTLSDKFTDECQTSLEQPFSTQRAVTEPIPLSSSTKTDLHERREYESRLAIQIQQCVIECLTTHLNTLMTSLADVVDSDSE